MAATRTALRRPEREHDTLTRPVPHQVDASSDRRRAARRHGVRQPSDRRQLERAGWRTTLDYVENQERGADGTLSHVVARWRAEGELVNALGEIRIVAAAGPDPVTAWSRLRSAIDVDRIDDSSSARRPA